VQLGLLLAPPLGWLLIAYLGSLAVLFISAFWSVDSFSGDLIRHPTLHNFRTLVETPVYRQITGRTVGIAAAVTLADALLAFPIAFYMAKVASRRMRGLLVIAILMPLWSSYLVKVYAWMIFPIYAGLERLPDSLLEASSDLGGRGWLTFRRVIMPIAFPAVVAGSIFTFSLSLGDYITPTLVSNTQFIGNVVYDNIGVAGNLPFAAAFATVPVVVMVAYLLLARRLGAFRAL